MRLTRWCRPALGALALLAAALLGAYGCNGSKSQHDEAGKGPGEARSVGGGGDSAPKDRAPLAGWETPQAVLVLSGEQHGYLEPCGCSEKQSGGMARRADLIRMIEEKGWPVAGLDLGGTIGDKQRQYRGLQTWYKFQAMLAALKDMNYAALGLGPEELKIPGDSFVVEYAENLSGSTSPALIGANATFADFSDFGPARSSVATVGGVKVGVTSVVGPQIQREHFAAGSEFRIDFAPAVEAIRAALKGLEAQNPDLLVLLSHASVEESKRFAEAFPEFDVVLTAGGPEDPSPEPQRVGETLLLMAGKKGKNVGVLGIYPKEAKERLKFELVELDSDRFQNAPTIRGHMRTYQDHLRENQEQVFADMADATHTQTQQTGATFVGAAKCGECHTRAYEHWKTTPHASAYQSLIDGREGEVDPIPRVHDPECLACHVTGWDPENKLRYDGGFLTAELARAEGKPQLHELLRDQQCENCHGPGSRHVELEEAADGGAEQAAARRGMWLSKEDALKSFCAKCHDPDNDPHFSQHEEEYWEKVKHPWRD